MTYSLSGDGVSPLPTFPVSSPRDPLPTDQISQNGQPYRVGQQWFNSETHIMFIYFGAGDWVEVAASTGDLLTLTDNSNSFVYPTGTGNIKIAAGAGITTTAGVNTLTIASAGVSFTWNTVTSATNPNTLANDNGYISSGGVLVTYTTPAVAAVGNSFIVTGNATDWSIAPGAGQSIQLGPASAAVGISSTLGSDTVYITCIVANTTFKVLFSFGNITFS